MNGQLGVDETGGTITQATATGKTLALILGAAQGSAAHGTLGVDENGRIVTQGNSTGKLWALILGASQNR